MVYTDTVTLNMYLVYIAQTLSGFAVYIGGGMIAGFAIVAVGRLAKRGR